MKKITKLYLLALCMTCIYTASAQTQVTYYTSMGNFKVRLTDTLTPRTVDSFIARVSEKFYDGQIFHRVIDNFMIQGGDPLGTGFGGPGYSFPDEFVSTLKNVPAALAMANSGPNTNGSQFFINLVTNAHLDNHHTVFGMVYDNFVVVQNIGHVPTNSSNRPITNVRLDSIRIISLYVPAAVNEPGNGMKVAMYPNPARDIVHMELAAITTKVEIVNMAGRVVYCTEAKGTLMVDLREQPTGLYMVRLSNMNGATQSRLVVQ